MDEAEAGRNNMVFSSRGVGREDVERGRLLLTGFPSLLTHQVPEAEVYV